MMVDEWDGLWHAMPCDCDNADGFRKYNPSSGASEHIMVDADGAESLNGMERYIRALEVRLRWTPTTPKTMPDTARVVECCIAGPHRQLWTLQWVARKRMWWSEASGAWIQPAQVTYWREWAGWPDQEDGS